MYLEDRIAQLEEEVRKLKQMMHADISSVLYNDLSWNEIDSKYNWVAIDPDGDIYAFPDRPHYSSSYGWVMEDEDDYDYDYLAYDYENSGELYKDSLRIRPQEVIMILFILLHICLMFVMLGYLLTLPDILGGKPSALASAMYIAFPEPFMLIALGSILCRANNQYHQ